MRGCEAVSRLCGQRHGDGQVGMTGRRHLGQLQPASRALGKVRGIEQVLALPGDAMRDWDDGPEPFYRLHEAAFFYAEIMCWCLY